MWGIDLKKDQLELDKTLKPLKKLAYKNNVKVVLLKDLNKETNFNSKTKTLYVNRGETARYHKIKTYIESS